MNLQGLSEEQVAAKVKQGRVNHPPKRTKTTVGKIILKNTLTIFNLVNLILAVMIILVGAYKNLLFILVAIANTLISIINEVRAKRTVDKMRLISEQKPAVIRGGKTRQISQDQIVEGDLLVYSLGDQIIVDSKIVQGNIEVNESYVTGEQDNIEKRAGDSLTSGSFVVSGTCYAEAVHVGADNFIARLESNAHTIKTADSKLFTILNNIVKYISYALIPIGILLLWARFRVDGTTTEVAVTSTVAGLINMIPEGLILLTSSVLALATIRLSRQKVLVQDLYSVETLARVDTICLDKTGTLTTGKMTVHDYTAIEKSFEAALASILTSQTSENATISALKRKFLKTAKNGLKEPILEVINFSSERKHSGIKTKSATYLLGAVEFITSDQQIIDQVNQASEGYRTLAVIKNSKLLGYIRLEDEIRSDAKDIINYFYANDITIKIISGDDLAAVAEIAEKVGVKDLAGVDLSKEKSPNYASLVKNHTIFTRVTPSQKKQLIKALKKQGRTVAMTGDGVNDILAMKEADCSIAIGEGADAARKAAKLVLLNNNFAQIPSIIDEGRQSINNLERSATLFLCKTTYASILAVTFTILPFEYPYAPIEMSLLNATCIGLPGLILALEKNTSRIKNRFVANIQKYSVPAGLTIAISMLALAITAELNNFTRPELLTASLFITFAIDFTLIYRISKPLNPLRTMLLATSATLVIGVFLIPFSHDLLDLGYLSGNSLFITIILLVAALALFAILSHLAKTITVKPKSKPRQI